MPERDPGVNPNQGDLWISGGNRHVVMGTKTVVKQCVPWLRVLVSVNGASPTWHRIAAFTKWTATAKFVPAAVPAFDPAEPKASRSIP